MLSLKTLMEGSSMFFPSFWRWWPVFGILWFVATSLQSLPPLSHGLLSVDLYSKVFLTISIPVIELGSTIIQYDHI